MIAIGSDHAGYEYKTKTIELLEKFQIKCIDVGTFNDKQSVDYPDFAKKVTDKILSNECLRGILICGSGVGMSIAANRYRGIRAVLGQSPNVVKLAREHNNCNVLCFGQRIVSWETAESLITTFVETPFDEDPRHLRRITKFSN